MRFGRPFLKLNKQVRLCCTETPPTSQQKPRLTRIGPSKTRISQVKEFARKYPHIKSILSDIPRSYLFTSRKDPDNLYLIDENAAHRAASFILPDIRNKKDQIICETNAGLGFISKALLESNVPLMRMYESNVMFRENLKKLDEVYPGRVEIFNRDIFHLYRFHFIDKQDNGDRVEQLLHGVPKRAWNEEPSMTIIGALPNRYFLNFLVNCYILQNDIASRGRFQLFLFMNPKDYLSLTASPEERPSSYTRVSVIFNLFFQHKLLDKVPREVFLPWPSKRQKKPKSKIIDSDMMYFVKINFKPVIPVALDNLTTFYFYLRHFFGRGRQRVIPALEKWVPGSGLNAIVPLNKHKDYYNGMSIFTQFRELTPNQILHVFHEMIAHPSYETSPLMEMVETHLAKRETIDPSLDERLEHIRLRTQKTK